MFRIRFRLVSLALFSAITFAIVSAHVERVGPELVEYGNMCGPSHSDPCYKPVLRGGFPVSFLFDAPGVSVERQLSFAEDRVSGGALAVDIVFYFTIIFVAVLVGALRQSVRLRGAKSA